MPSLKDQKQAVEIHSNEGLQDKYLEIVKAVRKEVIALPKTQRNKRLITAKIKANFEGVNGMLKVFKEHKIECDFIDFNYDDLDFLVFQDLKDNDLFNSKVIIKDAVMLSFTNAFNTMKSKFFEVILNGKNKMTFTLKDKEYTTDKVTIFNNQPCIWCWNENDSCHYAYRVNIDKKRIKLKEVVKGIQDNQDLDLITAMKYKKIFPELLENAELEEK